jgi:hypothetical protein
MHRRTPDAVRFLHDENTSSGAQSTKRGNSSVSKG